MIRFLGQIDKDKCLLRLKELADGFQEPEPVPPIPPIKREVGRFAYLPVEVKARDLPARAKLAGELAERGFEVIIGATWELTLNNWRDLPPGIILYKTMNYFDTVNMFHAACAGHINAVLNEELFSVRPDKKIYEAHLYPGAQADLICAQGEAQKRILEELGHQAEITGNPRAARTSQVLYVKDRILVTLMTGNVNGILPFHEYMGVAFRALGRSTGAVYDLMAEQIEHECDMHPLILECANDLASTHRDRQIIIRPHPVENPLSYATSGNCIIDDRVPIGERLRTVDEVYYVSGCGSGIDAQLAAVKATRVGTGGQGLSALDEPLDRHFAPCRLAEVLDEFQQSHARKIRIGAAKAFSTRAKEFRPMQFHIDKFPLTEASEVHPNARQIGWNLWSIAA